MLSKPLVKCLKRFAPPAHRFMVHHTRRPPVGKAIWGDLRRVTPISLCWGSDRGLPVDRYYIEKFLAKHATDVCGHALEIGDNEYTLRYGGNRVIKSDILHIEKRHPKVTLVADLTDAPHLPSDMFNCIILTQTLQQIYDLPAATRTLYRLLKPGGVLLATVPGICQIESGEGVHGEYWRFNTASSRRLFESVFPATYIEVEAHGNVLAAIAILHGLAAEELTQDELDYKDSNYQNLITIRAVKTSSNNS